MKRSLEPEIMDGEDISGETLAKVYREIQKVNRWLGNTSAIIRRLRQQQATTKHRLRVLDIGCGQGGLLAEIRDRLNVDVIGIDLRAAPPQSPIPILTGNAAIDPLPEADVAICVMLAHHLSETELAGVIANVSRSCQRFLILDPVRHPAPLWLFRVFLTPLLNPINAADGQTSIRRAYTVGEMHVIVEQSLAKSGKPVRSFQHTVAPLWIRQFVDIRWKP